jgi:hypothetical protein
MSEFGVWLAALFTGVFGAMIGFIVIAFVAIILALPFLLMNRKSLGPKDNSMDARYE